MSAALLGRGLVLAGIVAGLLAVGLPSVSSLGVETRYVDDGTSRGLPDHAPGPHQPAAGRDRPGPPGRVRRLGRVRILPRHSRRCFAFDSFGGLDAGAWLGPLHGPDPDRRSDRFARPRARRKSSARIDRGPGLLVATVGLVLIAVGIWLDVGRHGQSYWNASSSGHAVGLLLIVLVVTNAVLLAAAAHSSARVGPSLVVLVAAATFGFVVSASSSPRSSDFGTLGAGAWVEAAGGTLLLGRRRLAAARPVRGCGAERRSRGRMNEVETPVLIVGGSLVGLSTAVFLGARGVPCLVVERHRGTAIHPRAALVNQRTMETYRAVGIEPAIEEAAAREFVQNGAIVSVESLGGKELDWYFRNINEGVEDLSPSARIFITQIGLEPVLLAKASEVGARVEYAAETLSLDHSDDGVVATIRPRDGGEDWTVRARYAIAADGAHSPIARAPRHSHARTRQLLRQHHDLFPRRRAAAARRPKPERDLRLQPAPRRASSAFRSTGRPGSSSSTRSSTSKGTARPRSART